MTHAAVVPFKIVLAGGKNVGKSSVAFWLRGALGLEYIAQSPKAVKYSQFETYRNDHYVLIDPKEALQYPLNKRYYKNAHVLLACFNADEPTTIDALRRPVNEILDHTDSPIIFLINNQKNPALAGEAQRQSAKKLETFISVNGLDAKHIFIVNAKKGDHFEPLAEEIARLTLKNRLVKNKLEKYVSRIEKHAVKKSPDKINFAYGFHFFKSIRAKNREANYQLAKQLIEKLDRGENATDLLPQAQNLRKRYQPHWFFNHGIQSRELNSILNPKVKDIDKRR